MNSKRKKILFINGHLNIGGVEKSLVDLLNWIDYSLYDVDLFLFEGKGDYFNQLPSTVNIIYKDITGSYGSIGKVIYSNIKRGKFSNILFRLFYKMAYTVNKRLLFLLRIFFKLPSSYDCAIAYRPGFSTDLLTFCINSKRKISYWHHGECNYSPKAIKELENTWSHIDYIVTVSHGCKKMLETIFSLSSQKIHVIPNLIDINKIKKLANTNNPYIGEKIINIVTVGTITPEKHIEDVISIMLNLIKKGMKNIKWHIIGDGCLYNLIKENIKELKLESFIILHGQKINPYPYMKYADLYVHTSHVESQCLAVLEAMALKTPCVVCKSIGTKEYIISENNGILTEPNIEDTTKGIIKMLNYTEEKKKSIVQNAYITVTNSYIPQIINKKLTNLIHG